MPTTRALCVYCSSSEAVAPVFQAAAAELGTLVVAQGWHLVYGGANIGSMGRLASAVTAAGGRVVGVIPEYFVGKGLDYPCDELLVTATMSERKMAMAARADAFLALPGGFGTLEELLEVLVLKQLHYHDKAIVLLNVDGFFDPLLALFDGLIEQRFAKQETLALYHVAPTPAAALAYLTSYQPPPLPDKWL
jgi:uncharacterized protein (TIGR00730 family)